MIHRGRRRDGVTLVVAPHYFRPTPDGCVVSGDQDQESFISCSFARCKAEAVIVIGFAGGLCEFHSDAVWRRVERRDANSCHIETVGSEAREYDRADFRKKRQAGKRKPDASGQIYYVQVSGLIKVGWTSILASRIRSYGPTAKLLANYPGTRSDESNLHKQLAPSRAKGREWYNDDPIIQAFISRVLREHGPPRFTDTGWTTPKQVVAGKRHR